MEVSAEYFVTILRQGDTFNKHRHNNAQRRYVCCSQDLTKLIWAKSKTAYFGTHIKGSIPIADIVDILPMCDSKHLSSDDPTSEEKNGVFRLQRCFSVITPSRTVDLEANSMEKRDLWITALQYAVLLKQSQMEEMFGAGATERHRTQLFNGCVGVAPSTQLTSLQKASAAASALNSSNSNPISVTIGKNPQWYKYLTLGITQDNQATGEEALKNDSLRGQRNQGSVTPFESYLQPLYEHQKADFEGKTDKLEFTKSLTKEFHVGNLFRVFAGTGRSVMSGTWGAVTPQKNSSDTTNTQLRSTREENDSHLTSRSSIQPNIGLSGMSRSSFDGTVELSPDAAALAGIPERMEVKRLEAQQEEIEQSLYALLTSLRQCFSKMDTFVGSENTTQGTGVDLIQEDDNTEGGPNIKTVVELSVELDHRLTQISNLTNKLLDRARKNHMERQERKKELQQIKASRQTAYEQTVQTYAAIEGSFLKLCSELKKTKERTDKCKQLQIKLDKRERELKRLEQQIESERRMQASLLAAEAVVSSLNCSKSECLNSESLTTDTSFSNSLGSTIASLLDVSLSDVMESLFDPYAFDSINSTRSSLANAISGPFMKNRKLTFVLQNKEQTENLTSLSTEDFDDTLAVTDDGNISDSVKNPQEYNDLLIVDKEENDRDNDHTIEDTETNKNEETVEEDVDEELPQSFDPFSSSLTSLDGNAQRQTSASTAVLESQTSLEARQDCLVISSPAWLRVEGVIGIVPSEKGSRRASTGMMNKRRGSGLIPYVFDDQDELLRANPNLANSRKTIIGEEYFDKRNSNTDTFITNKEINSPDHTMSRRAYSIASVGNKESIGSYSEIEGWNESQVAKSENSYDSRKKIVDLKHGLIDVAMESSNPKSDNDVRLESSTLENMQEMHIGAKSDKDNEIESQLQNETKDSSKSMNDVQKGRTRFKSLDSQDTSSPERKHHRERTFVAAQALMLESSLDTLSLTGFTRLGHKLPPAVSTTLHYFSPRQDVSNFDPHVSWILFRMHTTVDITRSSDEYAGFVEKMRRRSGSNDSNGSQKADMSEESEAEEFFHTQNKEMQALSHLGHHGGRLYVESYGDDRNERNSNLERCPNISTERRISVRPVACSKDLEQLVSRLPSKETAIILISYSIETQYLPKPLLSKMVGENTLSQVEDQIKEGYEKSGTLVSPLGFQVSNLQISPPSISHETEYQSKGMILISYTPIGSQPTMLACTLLHSQALLRQIPAINYTLNVSTKDSISIDGLIEFVSKQASVPKNSIKLSID